MKYEGLSKYLVKPKPVVCLQPLPVINFEVGAQTLPDNIGKN